MQMPLSFFVPRTDWAPTPVSQLPSWRDAKRVSFDVETRDDRLDELGPGVRRGGYVVGFAFGIEDGPRHYLPIRHEMGGNLPEDQVLAYMRDQAREFLGTLVGHKLSYDLDFAAEAGVTFDRVEWYRDTSVADPLIDELHHKYSLDACAQRHGLPGKDERVLRDAAKAYGVHPKRELWRLHSRFVGPYAERDVELPHHLLRRQERCIDDQDLWRVWDLESRLLPVLVKMRRRGVKIDQDHLAVVERWIHDELTKVDARVHELTGRRVGHANWYNAGALAPILESVGIACGVDGRGNPSVNKDVLNVDHPLAEAVQRGRDVAKLGQFAATVRSHMTHGRIHCTINQVRSEKDAHTKEQTKGAGFGRCASEDPNLQNQPARDDELGPFWRKIYAKDDGADCWVTADYSQQEPRGCVHYASILNLQGAAEAVERYRNDPRTDFHSLAAELTGLPRKHVKDVGLGIMYGMGGYKLCLRLGLPTEWRVHPVSGKRYPAAGPDGQRIIDQFDAGVPFMRALAKVAESKARRTGFIRTLLGRVCHFPKDDQGNYDWTYKALNRLLQGSGADQTKKAIVDLDAAGFPLQLTVHDEIDWSAPDRSRLREAVQIMKDAVVMRVPAKVDLEVGDNWGEIEKIDLEAA